MFLSCSKMLKPENAHKSEKLRLIPICVSQVCVVKELTYITKINLRQTFSSPMDGLSLANKTKLLVQKSLAS